MRLSIAILYFLAVIVSSHGRRPRPSLNIFHVEPSVGQPWPKPQSMQSTPQQFAVHPSAFHFMINSTSQTCDTLTSAFDRYYRLIFFPQTYFDYILNPASATDDKNDKPKKSLADLHDATILKRLNIHMQQPCEKYPTLESDESCKEYRTGNFLFEKFFS